MEQRLHTKVIQVRLVPWPSVRVQLDEDWEGLHTKVIQVRRVPESSVRVGLGGDG